MPFLPLKALYNRRFQRGQFDKLFYLCYNKVEKEKRRKGNENNRKRNQRVHRKRKKC